MDPQEAKRMYTMTMYNGGVFTDPYSAKMKDCIANSGIIPKMADYHYDPEIVFCAKHIDTSDKNAVPALLMQCVDGMGPSMFKDFPALSPEKVAGNNKFAREYADIYTKCYNQ